MANGESLIDYDQRATFVGFGVCLLAWYWGYSP